MAKLNEIVVGLKIDALKYQSGLKTAANGTKAAIADIKQQLMQLKAASMETDLAQQGLGKSMKNMGVEVLGNIARFTAYYLAVGALKNIIGGAVSDLRNMDEALRNIQSITQESDDSITTLGKDLIGLVLSGKAAGQSASDLAAGMYEIVSAGYSTKDALDLLNVAAIGASAGLSDMKSTSMLLLGILQSYHLPVEDATEVMDKLFKIVDLGVIHMDDLTHTMGLVIPIAASLGVPLEQVGAAIELLTRQGHQPSRVMTGLADVMSKMVKPTDTLKAAMEGLGYHSGKEMIAALGLTGAIAALSRQAENGGPPVKDMSDKIETAAEASEQASQSVTDHAESVRHLKVELNAASDAANKSKSTDKDHAFVMEHLKQAQFNYNKAVRELGDAKEKVTKAQGNLNKVQQEGVVVAKDADTILAEEFGDIRAIREILPLAAHEGRDFNAMMEEQAASTLTAQKALEKQQKSVNFQFKALSSNIKAVVEGLLGFAGARIVPALAGLLASVNAFFAKLGYWVTESNGIKHWHFFWENSPKTIRAFKVALVGIIAFITAILIPIFVAIGGIIIGVLAHFGAFALIANPFAAIIVGIVMFLQWTGRLGDAWNLVKKVTKIAVAEIRKDVTDLVHFFTLGLQGGLIGGEHSIFEKVVFGIGKAIRDSIPHIKAFVSEMGKLGHLLVLGFSGGQIGGEFSKLEKAVFRAGQIIHQVLEFIQHKAIPWAIRNIIEAGKEVYAVFEKFRGMVESIAASPSFNAFLAYMKKHIIEIVDVVAKLVKGFIAFLQTPLGKFLTQIAGKIALVIAAIAFFSTGVGEIVGIISIAIAIVYGLSKAADWLVKMFHKVKDGASDVWQSIKKFVDYVESKAVSVWDTVTTAVTLAWETIKKIVYGAVSAVIGFIKDLVEKIDQAWVDLTDGTVLGTIYEFALKIGKSLVNGIVSGIKGIASEVGDIAQTIYNGIKSAFQQALDWAHENLHVHIGSIGKGKLKVDFGDIEFPHIQLARGVRDWVGGLAMMGENGPELGILPSGSSLATAPQTSKIMDNLLNGGSGVNVMADFNISVESFDEIKRKLYLEVDKLDQQLRYRSQRSGSSLNGQLVR